MSPYLRIIIIKDDKTEGPGQQDSKVGHIRFFHTFAMTASWQNESAIAQHHTNCRMAKNVNSQYPNSDCRQSQVEERERLMEEA